jgi:hypothetical protein
VLTSCVGALNLVDQRAFGGTQVSIFELTRPPQ